MAERRPLVIQEGRVKELPPGDTLSGVPGVSAWKEPVSTFNEGSPEILFTSSGDVVVTDAS